VVTVTDPTRLTSRREFGIGCPDGSVIDEDPWEQVEHAHKDVTFWDRECPCEGAHKVLVRTVTVSDWEPLDGDPVGRWKAEVEALSLPDLIASFGPVAEAGYRQEPS
jgi:hypothetical protein